MAVVAIAGNDGVARLEGRLNSHHHRFLADIEMAEAADQAHAVDLAGLLLEAADEQHVAVEFQQIDRFGLAVLKPPFALNPRSHRVLPENREPGVAPARLQRWPQPNAARERIQDMVTD